MRSNASVTGLELVTSDSDPITPLSELERELARAQCSEEAVTAVRLRPKLLTAPAPSPAAQALEKAVEEAWRERDYDKDLEWLILSGDSAMGERGTTGAVVGQIERGSVGGSGNLDEGGCYRHPYTDEQLGAGEKAIGEVELHRHLSAAWGLVKAETRRRLLLRYTAPHAEYRADQGFGAKDKYVEGSDARTGQHAPTRTGLNPDDEAWRYAALALSLTDKPGQLLLAYRDPEPNHMKKGLVVVNRTLQGQRARLRSTAIKLARKVSAADHAEWFAARARVAGMRSFETRIGRKRSQVTTSAHGVGKATGSTRLARMSEAAFQEAMDRGMAAAFAVAAE